MTNTIIPVGNNVVGNITDCKIENQLIKIEKNSVWSLREIDTYATYDVCSKTVIEQYSVPVFTDNAFGYSFLGLVALVFVVLVIASIVDSKY